MRNDTTGKTRGKHYSVADLRRMFEAYERNLCRKNPRSLSQIARGLGVPDSSFRDIITRAQTCLPSRFGNKQLQRFQLDMRKLEDNALKARQRHADAKLFPEAFFHALKPFMSPKGEIAPTTALKDLEAALRDDKNRAEILGKAPGWDGRSPCVKTIYNRITAGRSCAGMDASWLPEKGKRKRVNPSERKGRVAKRCPPRPLHPGHARNPSLPPTDLRRLGNGHRPLLPRREGRPPHPHRTPDPQILRRQTPRNQPRSRLRRPQETHAPEEVEDREGVAHRQRERVPLHRRPRTHRPRPRLLHLRLQRLAERLRRTRQRPSPLLGHLQAKWVNDSGKSEKSFMGGESFQGMGSGDGVDLVLDEVDFRRGDL